MSLPYDEFGLLSGNAEEYGLALEPAPVLSRVSVDVGGGQQLSGIRWGDAPPEIVFVHGGSQNAHTWDTVCLALRRPALCLDLPGHGHSDWRDDRDYAPERNAEAAAAAVRQLAPEARLVVGMSLGGLTSCVLASRWPELVRELVLVDVTPGVNAHKARAIIAFVRGPEHFESFDAILARTVEHNASRSEASLRRGVLHNAHELPDGRWTWRYDRRMRDVDPELGEEDVRVDHGPLWDHVSAVRAPLTLLRGSLSPVVDDADVAEVLRRQPSARVVVVDGAGHSIQGDRPLELAALLEEILSKPS